MLESLHTFLIRCLDLLDDHVYARFKLEEATLEKINELYIYIQEQIFNQDYQIPQKALENPEAFLTLYSAFDVDEQIIIQLLKTPLTSLSNSISFGELPNNRLVGNVSCNAIITSAAFGKKRNLELLCQSDKSRIRDIQIAVILAAYFGHSDIITYLATRDVKLFDEGCYIIQITPLLAAIQGEQPETFGLLLKCNPPEKMFWDGIAMHYDEGTIHESPYATAIKMATEKSLLCAKLIEDKEASIWYQLKSAIKKHDMNALNKLLEKLEGKNVFMFSAYHMVDVGGYLFKCHNTLSIALRSNNFEAFSILLEKLDKCNPSFVINTLIDVQSKINQISVDEHTIEVYKQQVNDLLNKHMAALKDSINLTIDGDSANQEMLNKCYSLISENKVKEISLLGTQFHYSNIENPMELLSVLLTNTSVTYCNLTYSKGKDHRGLTKYEYPLIALLDLILERNREIAELKSQIFQDAKYNQYVEPINQCIKEIKPFLEKELPDESFEKLKSIENKTCYTFIEWCSFTIFNNSNINTTDVINDLPNMINPEGVKPIEDLIKINNCKSK